MVVTCFASHDFPRRSARSLDPMLRLLLALALLGACGAWTPQPLLHAPPRPASRGAASSIAMKKRQGARMPGKAMQRPPTENVALKRKMKGKDFAESDDWVPVLEKADAAEFLAGEVGSTKAVQAGQDYKGNEFIWSLMLGEEEEQEDGQVARTVYAMDGSCRQCKFPMLEGKYSREDGVPSVSCPVCGNVNDLSTGEVTTFLPANNPVQWAAKLANEKDGPQRLAVLPTRVSKAGRLFLRLPDGTLNGDRETKFMPQ